MSFRRYEIILPTRYNDGTPISEQDHLWAADHLVEQFGAYTFEPQPIQGFGRIKALVSKKAICASLWTWKHLRGKSGGKPMPELNHEASQANLIGLCFSMGPSRMAWIAPRHG